MGSSKRQLEIDDTRRANKSAGPTFKEIEADITRFEDRRRSKGPVGPTIETIDADLARYDQVKAGKNATENMKQYGMKSGGSVKSASARADGCAIRGKTRA
jgi:hypothetical protein